MGPHASGDGLWDRPHCRLASETLANALRHRAPASYGRTIASAEGHRGAKSGTLSYRFRGGPFTIRPIIRPCNGRVGTMKARQLIDGTSYGPDALKALGQAFDEAWASIAGNFGDEPLDMEQARLKLAKALLSVASEDSRNVEVLKKAALQ